MYSNSSNDVSRMAQRYGTIYAHTRRRASIRVVFVVFCLHMHSFAGLIRRLPSPTISDTAITDRHSDTIIFQLRAHWVRISWSTGSEKSFGYVPPVGVEPSTSCVQGEHPARWFLALPIFITSWFPVTTRWLPVITSGIVVINLLLLLYCCFTSTVNI